RQCRVGGDGLAARTRGQVDAAQVDGHGADGTDAIEAELDLIFGAELLERAQFVENAGGSFTMGGPKPANLGVLRQATSNLGIIERLAPADGMDVEFQTLPGGVINEPIAKFAVAQNQPWLVEHGKLGTDGVVGQAA